MKNETGTLVYKQQSDGETDWEKRLKSCHGFFTFKKDEAKKLQTDVQKRLKVIMDLKRHKLASQFFNELKKDVEQYRLLVGAKMDNLNAIAGNFVASLDDLKRSSKPKSKFQIFLHSLDQIEADVDDDTWKGFCNSSAMPSSVGDLDSWLAETRVDAGEKLGEFAVKSNAVQAAVGRTIEDAMKALSPEKRLRYVTSILQRAQPMWSLNDQGLDENHYGKGCQIIVGVNDRDNTIMEQDTEIVKALTTPSFGPQYANTGQTDRIYVMVLESASPVFAVNNFKVYEEEHKKIMQNKECLSCSIDVGLDALREAQNFSLWPDERPDEALDMWTQGFCFKAADGLPIIRFDKEKKQYWMKSRTYGKGKNDYRYDLGQQRDVAYQTFETCRLYEEVSSRIKEIEDKESSAFVKATLNALRGTGNNRYKEEFAYPNMDPAERIGVEDNNPVYSKVGDLLDREIDMRTKEA